MRVDLETVRLYLSWRRLINQTPLEDIEWYEDGKRVLPRPGVIEDFKYTGLCNVDFIASDWYKETETLDEAHARQLNDPSLHLT